MTYEVNGFYYNDESFEMEPAKVIIHNVSNAKESENIAKEKYKTEMEILRACMEGVELDAKLVSDGEIGRNWHELVPADTYGVVHESA